MKKIKCILITIILLVSIQFSGVFSISNIKAIGELTPILVENNNTIYANGNAIVIKKGEDGLVYVFDENGQKLHEKSVVSPTIYGGGKNKDITGDVSITIDSVPYSRIYGGGYSNGVKSANLIGNIGILVMGKVDANSVYGGGYAISEKGDASANVTGNIDVKISAIPISNHGNIVGGGEAYAYNGNKSYAQVQGNVSTYVTGRTYSLRGGGSASATTENDYANADIYGNVVNTADNVDIREIYGGGYANNHASANVNSITNKVINNSEIMILQSGGQASGNSTATVQNITSSLEQCINIYGYVLGGGSASNGGNTTVENVDLTITNSIIPAEKQFDDIVASPVYAGGDASGNGSNASVKNARLSVVNTETCGTLYGGGDASNGAIANVENTNTMFINLAGTTYGGNVYYSTIVAGGSFQYNDSSILVNNSNMIVSNSTIDNIWGGAEKNGEMYPISGRSNVIFEGEINANSLGCFDTITMNNSKPLRFNSVFGKNETTSTELIVDVNIPIGTTLIKCSDINNVDKTFTIRDGKADYKVVDNMSYWSVGQVTWKITTNANEFGSISDSKTVNQFTNLEITWKPNDKCEIFMVFIDGQEVDVKGNSYLFKNITNNHTVNVIFRKIVNGGLEVDTNPNEKIPEVIPNIPKEKEKELLSEEDKKMILSGKKISFGMSVQSIKFIPTAAKIEMEKVIDKENVLLNLDINMFKKIETEKFNLVQLNAPIDIEIVIPKEFVEKSDGREFAVMRTHENEDGTFTSTILKDKDNNENTVTFETNQFSVYSLIYDVPKDSSNNESMDSPNVPPNDVPNEMPNDVPNNESSVVVKPNGVAAADNSQKKLYEIMLLISFVLMNQLLKKKEEI